MSKEDTKVPYAELSAEELEKVAIKLQDQAIAQEEKEKELIAKEKELTDKEKKLNKLEKELSKKADISKDSKPEPGLEFEFEDGKYKFLDSAPKKISIGGKGYSQKEISESEELVLQLIGGNSGLIIKA